MASDPTLETIRSLDDPAKFVRKDGVPIWVPHTRRTRAADGSDITITVTKADLKTYAANLNKLESSRGVLPRLTDGHLKPGEPGKAPPPPPKLVGYFRNARVGTFGPENTPAVLADLYYFNRPEILEVVSERPYRSPEVYTNVKEIRGLALMLNDPFLDMGTVTYGSDSMPICYGGDHMPGAAMGPKGAAMPAVPAAPEAKPDESPEEKELFEKMRSYMCRAYGLDEGWPGAPKPAPEEAPAPAPAPAEEKKDVTAMGRAGTPEFYAREVGQLKAQIQGLQIERDQERCQMLIYGLESEGYSLTPEEKTKELKKLAKLPLADRTDRVEELRVIYANRKPPEGQFQLYGGPVEGGEPNADNDPFAAPAHHEAAVSYMMANPGITYERAVAHAQGKK